MIKYIENKKCGNAEITKTFEIDKDLFDHKTVASVYNLMLFVFDREDEEKVNKAILELNSVINTNQNGHLKKDDA